MGRVMKMGTVIDATCYDEAEERLFRAVMRQMSPDWSEVWERPEDFRDAGAGVGGFIYYTDTEKFAQKHIKDILAVLAELEEASGEPLKKDKDNPLNWLAWFALEHTIDKVMRHKWCSAERSSLHKKTCLYVARCNAIAAAKKRAMSVFD